MPCFRKFADNPFIEYGILLRDDNDLEHGRQVLPQVCNRTLAGQSHGLKNLVSIFGFQASSQRFYDGRIAKLIKYLDDLPPHRPILMMEEVFQ